MDLKGRLQELMNDYGLITQQDLADFAGVSKGLVGQWFNGQTGLGKKPLLAFEKKTNFSTRWLADGLGDKYRKDLGMYRSSENLSDDLETVRLDLYDVSASCGSGHLNVDYPELLHSLEIPKAALKELLGTDNLHGVKLMSPDGDSMEPTIPPKSITLIKTDVAEFESSGVYLFTFQGYTYIKRLARGKAGVIHVTSDNPIYSKSDFVIEPEEFDDLFIHGKFWKVLPLDFLDI